MAGRTGPTAFTKTDLDIWSAEFERLMPKKPATFGFRTGLSVASFRANGQPTGLVLLAASPTGSEHLIALNPAVAHRLMLAIMEIGQHSGWLGDDLKLNIPGPRSERNDDGPSPTNRPREPR